MKHSLWYVLVCGLSLSITTASQLIGQRPINIYNNTGQTLYYAFGNTQNPPKYQPVKKLPKSTIFSKKYAKAHYGSGKNQASMVLVSLIPPKPGSWVKQYAFDPSKAQKIYLDATKSGNSVVLKPRKTLFDGNIKGNITADRIAAEKIEKAPLLPRRPAPAIPSTDVSRQDN